MSAQQEQTAADPYAELKAAWDAGRRIRISDEIYPTRWYSKSDGASLNWDCPPEDYEIEPLPADKWAAEKEIARLTAELKEEKFVCNEQSEMLGCQSKRNADLAAELASLQKSYEVERHCSGERMAQILELKREVERVTAERDLNQIHYNNAMDELQTKRRQCDHYRTQLAAVTAERDRLTPRLISMRPTAADANNDSRVLLLGDGNSAHLAKITDWDQVHSSWRRWLPLNLASYGIQTAEEVERERFEKWWNSSENFSASKPVAWHVWQAARAAKEVQV